MQGEEGEGVEEGGVLAIAALPPVSSTTQHLNSQSKDVIFVERTGKGVSACEAFWSENLKYNVGNSEDVRCVGSLKAV